MKRQPIYALTSLRFFAAFMVFLSHLNYFNQYEYMAIGSFFPEGHAGVTFFFILSGFILSYSYQAAVVSGKTSWLDFMIFRIARIYPLHWLTLLIAIAFLYNSNNKSWGFLTAETFLPNFFLVQSFFNNTDIMNSYNGVSWSLSNEMFFYALFPLAIRMRTGALLFTLLALVIMTLTWLPVEIPFSSFHLPRFTDQSKYYSYFYPPCRFSDFLLGMLLYRKWQKNPEMPSSSASLIQFISLISLLGFFSLSDYVDETYRFDFYYALPMALVVYAFSFQSGIFSFVLSGKALVILGEASFAFYMIHQLVINHIARWLVLLVCPRIIDKYYFSDVWHTGIILSITVFLSLALYYLFEIPSKNFFVKLLFNAKAIFSFIKS